MYSILIVLSPGIYALIVYFRQRPRQMSAKWQRSQRQRTATWQERQRLLRKGHGQLEKKFSLYVYLFLFGSQVPWVLNTLNRSNRVSVRLVTMV